MNHLQPPTVFKSLLAAASCAEPIDPATARSCRPISPIWRSAVKPGPQRRILPLEHSDLTTRGRKFLAGFAPAEEGGSEDGCAEWNGM